MKRTSWRRRVVAVTASAVGVAGVVAAPIASHASTRSSHSGLAQGFYLTGVGRVFAHPGLTAVVVDDQHRVHAIRTILGGNPYPRALAYYVHDPRTGRTTQHTLQLGVGTQHSPIMELSGDGTRIDTVAMECGGVVASSTPVGARRLKPFVDADVGRGLCSNGDTVVRALDGLAGRQMAIVTASDDTPAPDEGNTLFVGTPGHPFRIAATDLPGTNLIAGTEYLLEGLLGRTVGHLTAVLEKLSGSGADENDGRVDLYFSKQQSGGTWSTPQPVVATHPPAGYLDTIAAPLAPEPGGRYFLAIDRSRISHPSSTLRPRYAVVGTGGTVSATHPLPGTTAGDFSVSFATGGDRVYATFIRPARRVHGWIEGQVREEVFVGSHWKRVSTGVASTHVSDAYLVPASAKPRIAYTVGSPLS
jgi:hypothetical protein